MSVRATVLEETRSIHKYIRKTALWKEQLQECLRELKTDGDEEQEEKLSWKTKPLHGMHH